MNKEVIPPYPHGGPEGAECSGPKGVLHQPDPQIAPGVGWGTLTPAHLRKPQIHIKPCKETTVRGSQFIDVTSTFNNTSEMRIEPIHLLTLLGLGFRVLRSALACHIQNML